MDTLGTTVNGDGRGVVSEGRYPFGFWSRIDALDAFCGNAFRVTAADGAEGAVRSVLNHAQRDGDWFEPPVEEGAGGLLVPVRRFELPVTHVLATPGRPHDDGLGEFLVLVLGFALGMRFTVEGTGHLARAAIGEATLVNFSPRGREVLHVLGGALAFWDAHAPEVRRLAFGTVHWHLSAQSHQAQHDGFAWAYTVLDGLHKLALSTSSAYASANGGAYVPHGQRPPTLASVLGIPLPASFASSGAPAGALVRARNELVHEARWDGEPIGYAGGQDGYDLTLDLRHFCSQVILRLLGVECEFCRHTYSRQLQGLDVDGLA